MKNARFLAAVMLPVLAGTLLTTQEADAACKVEQVNVRINEHGIWMKPDGGPKCLFVSDLSDVNVSFTIKLKTPGAYALRDGQVHIRQAIEKEENGTAIGCSSDLEFEESEYTNVGENDIEVTVIGEDISEGEFICYEIVVDDIGMLDPRAEVEDQDALRGHLGAELAELYGAFNLLNESSLGDSLTGQSFDDFVESNYDISAEEAQELIDDVRE